MHLLRALAHTGLAPVSRRTIPIAQPAAQGSLVLTPETGRAWQVLSVQASLVTASDAGNRAATLALGDGTNTLWTIPPTAVQAASLTVGYSWIAGYVTTATAAVAGYQAVAMPPAILLPGWTLTAAIGSVLTTDRFSAGYAQVLEVLTGETEAEYNLARAIEHRSEAIAELLHGAVPGA